MHQLNDYFWLCSKCYREQRNAKLAKQINWNVLGRNIESLAEALYYFAFIQAQQGKYDELYQVDTIKGRKGPLCYVVEKSSRTLDPFNLEWYHHARYYILYNRSYLRGANREFERASMFRQEWQSCHMRVLSQATQWDIESQSRFKGNTYITIVMSNRDIHYVRASIFKQFVFEYEAINTLPGETETTGHMPIAKMLDKNIDPYPW